MNSQNQATRVALIALLVLAALMVGYYKFAWRFRKTENDVNFQERTVAPGEEKTTLNGAYSADGPVEGLGRRLGFLSLNQRDGTYLASIRLDTIGATESEPTYVSCGDVRIGEKEFFVGCRAPEVGEISFHGEWQRSGPSVTASGNLLWAKDGAEILSRATTFTRTTN